jgi:hypothetical protein
MLNQHYGILLRLYLHNKKNVYLYDKDELEKMPDKTWAISAYLALSHSYLFWLMWVR